MSLHFISTRDYKQYFFCQHLDMLDAKVTDLTKQLDIELHNKRNSELKCKRIEADFLEMQQGMRKFEGELAAGDMMRDGLRIDKERVSV